jgi:four helix bundle protein
MPRVRSFRDLEVWRAAMDLAVASHNLARSLPTDHRFELAAQIRRAASSIPSNVAEGHAQKTDKVFLRHVRIALGSLAELDTQVEIAVRLQLIETQRSHDLTDLMTRTWQLLHGTRRALIKEIATLQKHPKRD